MIPYFAWLASGLAGGALISEKLKNNNSKSNISKNINQHIPQHIPQIIPFITPQQKQDSMFEIKKFIIYSAIGSVISFAVYRYFKDDNIYETKILPELIQARCDAINLVKNIDDKNENRIEKVENNNRTRALKLSNDIRSETRTNFDIISSQLYGLTQISLKTLGTINEMSIDEHTDEEKIQNQENISGFIGRANEFNKTLSTPNYWKQSHQYHKEGIQQEYPLLMRQSSNTSTSGNNPEKANQENNFSNITKKKRRIPLNNYTIIGGIGIGATILGLSFFTSKNKN